MIRPEENCAPVADPRGAPTRASELTLRARAPGAGPNGAGAQSSCGEAGPVTLHPRRDHCREAVVNQRCCRLWLWLC